MFRLGLRARLMLWTAAMLALSLAAGFAWVHHGLRGVLGSRNDAFLERKAAELTALIREEGEGGREALQAEIRREVAAYQAEGLIVIVRFPDRVEVTPSGDVGRRLADQVAVLDSSPIPRTLILAGSEENYRVIRTTLAESGAPGAVLELGLALALAETEATLAQFDRRVAAGGLAFLALAVGGGLILSRQALRPVARSIRTARRLNPADLSARLPLTGAGDELDHLAATINDLLDRLADYHAQVARFTADASHELRSPLGAILRHDRSGASAAPAGRGIPRSPWFSGRAVRPPDSAGQWVVAAGAADAGQVELRHEPLDLAALADEVVELYQPLAEERGVTLNWDHPGPVPARGDLARLRQLLTNLVDNAIKFTGPTGTVTIRLEPAADHAGLVVADTGTGIPAEHLPHVFERFYQADPARSIGGTGLGLSICRWITEAHGGSIHARSERGRGSTFTVTLPKSPRDCAIRSDVEVPERLSERGRSRPVASLETNVTREDTPEDRRRIQSGNQARDTS